MPLPQSEACDEADDCVGAIADLAIRTLAEKMGINARGGDAGDVFLSKGTDPRVAAIANVVNAVQRCEQRRCVDIIAAYRDEAQQIWHDFLVCHPVINSGPEQHFSSQEVAEARKQSSLAARHAHAAKIADLIIERIHQVELQNAGTL